MGYCNGCKTEINTLTELDFEIDKKNKIKKIVDKK